MTSPDVSEKISQGQKNSTKKKELHSSAEYREKMSNSLKGRKFSDEHRMKLSESLKGKARSDEHRSNPSDSLKKSEKLKGENNPFYGMKHSQDTIDKIRNSITNKNDRKQ